MYSCIVKIGSTMLMKMVPMKAAMKTGEMGLASAANRLLESAKA